MPLKGVGELLSLLRADPIEILLILELTLKEVVLLIEQSTNAVAFILIEAVANPVDDLLTPGEVSLDDETPEDE